MKKITLSIVMNLSFLFEFQLAALTVVGGLNAKDHIRRGLKIIFPTNWHENVHGLDEGEIIVLEI